MPDPTYIACPRCGEPYAMSAMQKRLFHGRTLTCQRCAKPFTVTEQTPDPVPAPSVRPSMPPEYEAPDDAPDDEPPAEATDPAVEGPANGKRASRSPAAGGAEARGAGAGGLPRGELSPGKSLTAAGSGLTPGRMALIIGVVALVGALAVYLAVAPSVHRAREAARRATCSSYLTQVGVALQFYANSNGGRFPDALDALVLGGSLPSELIVCPSSSATPAPGETPAEQAANLAKGNHVSYVYVGKGLTFASGRQIVVYEPLSHHENDGVNVLYTDGTAQFISRGAALTALPQLGPGGIPATRTAVTQPAVTAPAAKPPANPPAS